MLTCDYLFSTLVLPNFTYGLPVYGAMDSDLTVIQNFLDRCFKRKYTSKKMDIRELSKKANKKLFKVRSVDPDCPLSNIIPKKKEINQPCSQGLSSYCLQERARRDPGTRWSRATLIIENLWKGSSVIRQLLVLGFVEFKVLRCAATDITCDG